MCVGMSNVQGGSCMVMSLCDEKSLVEACQLEQCRGVPGGRVKCETKGGAMRRIALSNSLVLC